MAGRIIEAELRITGSDKSGAAFAGVIQHAKELEKTLAGLKGMKLDDPRFAQAAKQAQEATRSLGLFRRGFQELERSAKLAATSVEQSFGRMAKLRAMAGHMATGMGYLAGPVMLHATKAGVTAGASVESERVKMRAAGIPQADIDRETGRSADLVARYPNVKRADVLERYKEARSVMLHPEEASRLLEPIIRANSALNAIDRTGAMGDQLQYMIKGAESSGRAQDPERLIKYLDAGIKAIQVMGKMTNPEQIYEFDKMTKAAGLSLSDRFRFTIGHSMSQEIGGQTAGVGFDQLIKQVVGGFQGSQHAAAKEFVALGLANKDDFETTKTGSIKGLKHGKHVAGYKMAMTDPDQWVYKYVLPAMEKAGVTDPQEQLALTRRLFTSTRAADTVAKLIQQRPSFENHAKLYGEAQGIDAALGNNQKDPFVAFNALTTSLSNFASTLTSPIMEKAAGAMSNIASALGGLGSSYSKWAKANPKLAEMTATGAITGGAVGGGLLTYNLLSGLMRGFGLKGSAAALGTSATALDGAAAALTRAALAKGGKDVLSGVAGGAGGVAGGVAGGAAAGAAGSWLGALGSAAFRVGGPIGMLLGSTVSTGGKDFDEPSGPGKFTLDDIHSRMMGGERYAEHGPGSFTIEDIRGALSGGNIKAEVEGNANLNVEVKVEPSPDLITRIKTMLTNEINAFSKSGTTATGSTGSSGTSMPEAGPLP